MNPDKSEDAVLSRGFQGTADYPPPCSALVLRSGQGSGERGGGVLGVLGRAGRLCPLGASGRISVIADLVSDQGRHQPSYTRGLQALRRTLR